MSRLTRFILFPAGLLLFFTAAQAAKVDTRQIDSRAMSKAIPALVITPDSYANSTAPYPVVYLLHGKSGAYNHWANAAPLTALADTYNLIIVCPDGAKDSWYVDSVGDSNYQYETHISGEVVQYVDQNYRTIQAHTGRAIAGSSMGGHGALLLALRHKDIFGAAGSMSGVLDLRPFAATPNIGESIAARLGTMAEHPDLWASSSAINNIADLKSGDLAIIIDCGLSDGFLTVNRNFHKALTDAKIEHTYMERTGVHGWDYWKTSIQYQMLFFHLYFQQAAATAKTSASPPDGSGNPAPK
jgi:S-formylglutathione hydrolase FrmB